jgi:hypothetical protein
MTSMWFEGAVLPVREARFGAKTASDLRKRKCDRGHADPI